MVERDETEGELHLCGVEREQDTLLDDQVVVGGYRM